MDLVVSAARQQQVLADLGDELLDHFVQGARTAGCSWAQIGSALGVTKQAAQQRHSGSRGLLSRLRSLADRPFSRFDQSARGAVVRAQEEARRLGHPMIGTEHLLLGVLAASGDLAGRALAAHGLDSAALCDDVVAAAGPGAGAPRGHVPFTPGAKEALELALRDSRRLGDRHIGAEHVLLGVLGEGAGPAAVVLTAHGATPDSLRPTLTTLRRAPGSS